MGDRQAHSLAGAEGPGSVVAIDQIWIDRAKAGDIKAFERLYRQHVGRVNGLCLRMTRDQDVADDCVQETFIKAWRALAGFESRASLATWLHRIAVNVVLERRRRPERREESIEEMTDVDEQWNLDTPVETAELEAAIESLPSGAKDVLVLSGIYGYDHAETAKMLGIAVGTCKAQLHRARALMRERIEYGPKQGTSGGVR